jgi:copper chaperone CopZ
VTHDYDIQGMHCQSCVNKVGTALRAVPGVSSATVTLAPPRAHVEMSRHVPADELAQAVRTVGDYWLGPSNGAAATSAAPPLVQPDAPPAPRKDSLYPLFLIVAYIAGATALIGFATQTTAIPVLMRYFMAGFFLVFSFFKLLDLRGFADAYRSYDVVARAIPAWAFVYPAVELALGAAYLVDFNPMLTNASTLVLMLVGAVGVLKALLDKRAIRCACLGTALNLPMTTITLVEDLGMAAMAAAMLAMG